MVQFYPIIILQLLFVSIPIDVRVCYFLERLCYFDMYVDDED